MSGKNKKQRTVISSSSRKKNSSRSYQMKKKSLKRKSFEKGPSKGKPRNKAAHRHPKKKSTFFRNYILVSLATLTLLIISVLILFRFARVDGYGMAPILRDGNIVIAKKHFSIKRFDIVLIKIGNSIQVRRVIGLPGERVEYRGDILYVNNEEIIERFIVNQVNTAKQSGGFFTKDFDVGILGSQTIPESAYLLLGDNREYSRDSRIYGFVDSKQILGVVVKYIS